MCCMQRVLIFQSVFIYTRSVLYHPFYILQCFTRNVCGAHRIISVVIRYSRTLCAWYVAQGKSPGASAKKPRSAKKKPVYVDSASDDDGTRPHLPMVTIRVAA